MVFDIWVGFATVLVVISLALSFYAITNHLVNYTKPYLQRYIVRILLMVPIYSLNAWIAMLLPITGIYLDSFREIYESFVIYSFMKYLLNFLQYDTNLQQYIEYKPGPKHIFPFCCLPTCVGGKLLLLRCKHGILQYVIIRPITSLLAFISQLLNIYGEGNWNPLSGKTFPILLLINNASQLLAMYCLVIFYTGYSQELRPMKPLGKFFSIKLVVFFSFFQSVIISASLNLPTINSFFRQLFPELKDQDDNEIGRKMQELLICLDMLVASIAHQFAFPHSPFMDDDVDGLIVAGAAGDPEPEDDDNNNDHSIINIRHQDKTNSSKKEHQNTSSGKSKRSLASDSNSESLLIRSNQSVQSSASRTHSTYRQALYNLLDFTDERRDMNEHFVHIFGRFQGLFSEGNTMPVVEIIEDQPPAERAQIQRENGQLNTGSREYGSMDQTRTQIQNQTGSKNPLEP